MAQTLNKQPDEIEMDRQLRRFYRGIVNQTVPARFKILFDRLRDEEKELEHEA